MLHELRDENLQLPACSSRVGDGSGSRCSCGVSFSAPAVSWGPPPIAGVYNAGCRHSVVRDTDVTSASLTKRTLAFFRVRLFAEIPLQFPQVPGWGSEM